MKVVYGLLLFLFFSTQNLAQTSEKALKHYQNLGYMAFADAVKTDEDASTTPVAMLLANSYRLNGNPEAAAFWYARAVSENSEAETLLHYAQALQSAGNCREAISWYQKYLEKVGQNAATLHDFTEDCGALRNAATFGRAKVELARGLNTVQHDFSPVVVDGGIIFTSSRNAFNPVSHSDLWTKKEFTNLYFAPKNEDGGFGEPRPLFGNINKKYHDGAASVAAGGEAMFFTRNNLEGKNSKNVIDLKIYYSEKKSGFWSAGVELPFNSDEFGVCHPALSKNGRVMVFASDQSGGLGGMDLYVVKWENNNWSAPQNLGAEINTAGNEIFPFLANDDRLYFSSDSRAGLGGLDIFTAEKIAENYTWRNASNLGAPVNSEKDDFGIFVNEDGRSGYLSSSRNGGLGSDDIYTWSWAEAPKNTGLLEQNVAVIDALTGLPIAQAEVKLVEISGQNDEILNENKLPTDAAGKINFTSSPETRLTFRVNKPGYEPKTVTLPAADVFATPGGYKIPLSKKSVVMLSGQVSDADTEAEIPGAEIEFLNTCDNSVFVLSSDRAGEFATELKCGCKYQITTRKRAYILSKRELVANCEIPERELLLALLPSKSPAVVFEGEDLGVGKTVRLKNVYYDFDKWAIRSDASRELDKVVRLMNEYPGMEIELGSHTDSRGNDAYNARLSQKRAEAAVQYIISKGIAAHRIAAKGYGESQLVNRCANGVSCDDDAHQENRRTEIRITKMDDVGVKVIYDND